MQLFNQLCLPEISQLVNWIQWRDESLQSFHVIWTRHVLNQKLHLSLTTNRSTETHVTVSQSQVRFKLLCLFSYFLSLVLLLLLQCVGQIHQFIHGLYLHTHTHTRTYRCVSSSVIQTTR